MPFSLAKAVGWSRLIGAAGGVESETWVLLTVYLGQALFPLQASGSLSAE